MNVLFNELSIFQINESFYSFVYDSFVKTAIQKKTYIVLTKTCVHKDAFICVNKLLNARVQIGV